MIRRPEMEAAEPSEGAALREIRLALAATYPAVDSRAISSILRSHHLTYVPAGLLLAAETPAPRHLARAIASTNSGAVGHPLFNAAGYLAMNPDLARAGAPAWAHYQVFGRVEGRSPHPLIDVNFLAASIPDASMADVVDRYVMNPVNWRAEPGPYVECQAFLLSGRWAGEVPPLQQILTSDWNGPWIHRRLMMVDLASREEVASRLAAIALVLGSSPGHPRAADIAIWHRPAPGTGSVATPTGHSATAIVIPGFLLADREVLWSNPDAALSLDGTAAATATEFVGIPTADTITTPLLVYLTGALGRRALHSLVESLDSATVIAPSTRDEEISLRQLRRDLGRSFLNILQVGHQVAFVADELRIVPAPDLPVPAYWDGKDHSEHLAILLPISDRRRATGDASVRSLLESGAALCLVDDAGLNSWLPTIQSRGRVLTTPEWARRVGAFVTEDRIRLLPGRKS